MSKMAIGLASGSLEKLLVTSTVTGGAVALDMDVDIYLLLGGAYAFRKDVAENGTHVDRPELHDEMRAGMAEHAVPDPLENLRKLRADGKVQSRRVRHGPKELGAGGLDDFVDICDDIVGIAEYIVKCEEADVVQVF